MLDGHWGVTVAVCAVAAGPAVAAKGGNNNTAHACQQGGRQTLVAAENPQVPFKNAGDCPSHGAQGGDTSSLSIDNSGTYPCRPPDQHRKKRERRDSNPRPPA